MILHCRLSRPLKKFCKCLGAGAGGDAARPRSGSGSPPPFLSPGRRARREILDQRIQFHTDGRMKGGDISFAGHGHAWQAGTALKNPDVELLSYHSTNRHFLIREGEQHACARAFVSELVNSDTI